MGDSCRTLSRWRLASRRQSSERSAELLRETKVRPKMVRNRSKVDRNHFVLCEESGFSLQILKFACVFA